MPIQMSPSGAMFPYYYKGGEIFGTHTGSYFSDEAGLLAILEAEVVKKGGLHVCSPGGANTQFHLNHYRAFSSDFRARAVQIAAKKSTTPNKISIGPEKPSSTNAMKTKMTDPRV